MNSNHVLPEVFTFLVFIDEQCEYLNIPWRSRGSFFGRYSNSVGGEYLMPVGYGTRRMVLFNVSDGAGWQCMSVGSDGKLFVLLTC